MKTFFRALGVCIALLLLSGVALYVNPLWFADQIAHARLYRAGVASESIHVDGYSIHYFEARPKDGPGTPLVLIHGLGSRGEDWSPLIAPLAAAGFHVYVPDLLGYGRSARPNADYSISFEEKAVVDFMRAAHISTADVGGWSMGGWVAAKLTLDHPELVDRLVLYDSAGIYFPATFGASLFTPSDRAGFVHLTEMLQPMPDPMPDFVVNAVIRRLRGNAWVVNRSVDAMAAGRDLLDFRLASMQRPTLLVWGGKDALIPPPVAERMHRLIPDSSLTFIDGCGHLAPAQCWHSVLNTTVQFLKSNPPEKNQEQILPGN